MQEVWKDIPDYEGLYQVSNLGRVKSLQRKNQEQLKTQRINKQGYLMTQLWKNNICRTKRTNRLVAQAFIPNPNNLPQVNHKDENKLNNCVSNLEWCTDEYNKNYGTRNIRIGKAKSKKVKQFDLKGNYIKTWDSVKQAQKKLKLFHIYDVCNKKHRYKTCGGYIWKYE